MSSAFVSSDTARIDLSDGRWIEIKARLTWGETQALAGAALVGTLGADGKPDLKVDPARHPQARLEMYLVDWNFADATGKTVAVSPAAIASLDPAVGQEIEAAIDAHEARTRLGKATPSTSNGLIATLPS